MPLVPLPLPCFVMSCHVMSSFCCSPLPRRGCRPDEFKELIDAVFRFDWRANEKIVRSFSGLLSHLVSANSTCMVPAMHMLVRNLVLTLRDLDGEGNDVPDQYRTDYGTVSVAVFRTVSQGSSTGEPSKYLSMKPRSSSQQMVR